MKVRHNRAAEAIFFIHTVTTTYIIDPETNACDREISRWKLSQCRRFAKSLPLEVQDAIIAADLAGQEEAIADIINQVREQRV